MPELPGWKQDPRSKQKQGRGNDNTEQKDSFRSIRSPWGGEGTPGSKKGETDGILEEGEIEKGQCPAGKEDGFCKKK